MSKIINLFGNNGGNDMVTIIDVADAFLSYESMTPKKLQKLCYYTQAWHEALKGTALIDNRFEAWVHGPVCPELYYKYRHKGWLEIPKKEQTSVNISDEIFEFLDEIYDTYGHLDGDELEALTHSELPWQEQRIGLAVYEPSNNEISVESMKKFYGEMYEQNQGE
ncbi:MAG: DUF4065 domain-containing protein [Clostridium sp.]|uniref:Panacea domain-containing protein n=1 Tax=Clostridium sp. TaxID=1506 RepID=UPI00302A4090